ncbi:MAG: SAM-dependent methyltransferase [Fibromonadaceae bacterium]|jgi:methylase of polypeptide subunit release factors|nr:SAM-dependent methyltransferase [Fibromonadaceae bacterium]
MSKHLSHSQKTNLGSFYTPPHLVNLVYETLAKNVKGNFADVVLEPACGYGAFFAEKFPQKNVRFIGTDIDPMALTIANKKFSNVEFKKINMLSQISRLKYGIEEKEKLIIVGNPPYNDVTSRVKNKIKAEPCEIAQDVRTRDLGLSFMLAFAKLKPNYIAVLHPLSYLIKKANFEILKPLMQSYTLLDAVVFNSQEFSETSKSNGFPIVATVYEKNVQGTSYEQIVQRKFRTLEKQEFSISDFDYVCRYISKYPSRYSKASDLKFFTMRDINALKRSRTFIKEDTENAIYIEPQKLPYYCYVDIFKDIASKLPYYFGNLDVPFNKSDFEKLKDDFFALSLVKHPDIFANKFQIPKSEHVNSAKIRVQNYFNKLFKGMDICL